MTPFEVPELFTRWEFWYAVGGAVVVVAATLLVAIVLVARSIDREARRALEAVRRIRGNTDAIWELEPVLRDVEAVHGHARAVAEATDGLARTVHGSLGGAAAGSEAER